MFSNTEIIHPWIESRKIIFLNISSGGIFIWNACSNDIFLNFVIFNLQL